MHVAKNGCGTTLHAGGWVSRTANPLENCYRQSDPESTKKRHKTSLSISNGRRYRMVKLCGYLTPNDSYGPPKVL